MVQPTARPCWSEVVIDAQSTSIGATPVAGVAVVQTGGYVQRIIAAPGGTTTGTISVAVAVNAGSDITAGALTIPAGSNARPGSVLELPLATASAVTVTEGDIITFTPSGGGGASIPGAFGAVIRAAG